MLVAARREAECRRVVGQIVAAGGSAEPWQADVTLEADVERMMTAATRRLGRLDVAVNNAGVLGEHGPLPNLTEAGWGETYEGNATSVFLCLKHELPARAALAVGAGEAGRLPMPRHPSTYSSPLLTTGFDPAAAGRGKGGPQAHPAGTRSALPATRCSRHLWTGCGAV